MRILRETETTGELTMRSPADSRRRNALILALKRAIEATFNHSDWKELGYLTDTRDWIVNHHRLLRSLAWGDPDYASCVLDAIEMVLQRDPANLQVVLGMPKLRAWLEENEPAVYSEILGLDLPAEKTIKDAEEASRGFDVGAHISRIYEALEDDPALAVGSTKELLESVMKTVLGLHGTEVGADDMPKLLKNAQAALGIDAKDVDPTVPGAESFRRLLGSLAQIVVSVNELRNLYGTGHGKSKAAGLDPAAARLIAAAGTALAAYLMERYNELKEGQSV
jgi:hypothetical protein